MSKKRSTRSRSSRQSKRPLRPTPQPPVAEEVVEETAEEPTSLPQEHQVPEEQADFFARMEEELASPSDEAVPVDEEADEEVVREEEVTEESPSAATVVEVSSDEEADETINEVPVTLVKTDEVETEPEIYAEEVPSIQDEEEGLADEEVEEVDDDDRLPRTDFEDDDEEFLSSDKIVHQEKNLAIVQQMENVVSWEIANFYKDNGKVPNKFVMRGSPPLFKITSSKGDSAEFMITRDLAKTLEEGFGDVRKAYYGIDPTIKKNTFGQKNFKEKTNAAVEWFKDNPVKGALAVIIIIFFLLSPFLY